ncbi:FMN-binding negative transcriptional regulator [Albidovulum sediminicola]|uniref:FMN-binding negative transcriptional regulator n=1 Tax=Albidovulum sediminicola TaxID=2984331 RepID=A0ABT2YWA5_9RHOB|nr:FMN-binding negative transcriptional regulator [Defluviimonas sp. WL0075]MCV2863158.1 FMN-binding negative transcriptional regulator [Defluviimonas sp. WL0075]
MHPNPVYRQETAERNLAFARDRGFGALAVNGPDGPLLSHVPFVLGDGFAEMHLVRSNPIARALGAPVPALLAVSGPDGYVSPDWYGLADQVPTWNYVAVHLRGTLHLLTGDALRGHLDRLSATFENRIAGKAPWLVDKVDGEALDRLMRMIVPCRFDIASIEGTWKLGQNKPGSARTGAAEGMEAAGIGAEVSVLARLMRESLA